MKEISIQLPELSKLDKFNDLIEGMNEKCFSFKNENFIEKYKNNHIDDKNYNKINNIINNNEKNNVNDIDKGIIWYNKSDKEGYNAI